ncbi:glycosyltransferase [Shewanella sp. NKUCC01_JLK]|uniref:glycosyltransferase n=1 Tax=Shewanella sp. NKUCC01_JLK TaxID=2842123 RepID=UPI001C5B1C4C|nr:glycosyltransferase [Shewanella sp. NKUCC01_JLK]MBW3514114.1 glycosyltransferase [Shewanella sp. NKUCC01_JLK]
MAVRNFSVLMSLYNAENPDFLEQCFMSVNTQVLKPTELVLVLDGPINPDLHQVISRWVKALNIVIVPLEYNVGLSKALNHGLNFCKYELVARMDTDDMCYPERFIKQIEFMADNDDVDILGGYCEDITVYGDSIRIRKVPTQHDLILKSIWTCPFIHPSVIFRKSKILSIGSYSENAPHRQDDYELWIRAAFAGFRFSNLPLVLIKYRVPVDAYKKNTVAVGYNRIRIGLRAVIAFDPKFTSFLGLFYPLFRALLPYRCQASLAKFVNHFDPRSH